MLDCSNVRCGTLYLGILCTLLSSATAQVSDALRGRISITAATGYVEGNLEYAYARPAGSEVDTVSFLLPRALSVSEVSGSEVVGFELIVDTSTYLGKLFQTIAVATVAPSRDSAARIGFKYAGVLPFSKPYGVGLPVEWIEASPNLTMVAPLTTDFRPATLDLEIEGSPGYELTAPGQTTRLGDGGGFGLRSDGPTLGVAFVLAKAFQDERFGDTLSEVRIISYGAKDSTKAVIAGRATEILSFYNATFGVQSPRRKVTVTMRPSAALDASYAVGEDYFATYDPAGGTFDDAFFFGILAHELAHLWWHTADASTRDNWINEGLAEYSSGLAVERFLGEAAFGEWLADHVIKIAGVADTISLYNYERFGAYDKVMAYSKSAFLFHEIRMYIGLDKFNRLLAKLYEIQVRDVDQFLEVLLEYVIEDDELARIRRTYFGA